MPLIAVGVNWHEDRAPSIKHALILHLKPRRLDHRDMQTLRAIVELFSHPHAVPTRSKAWVLREARPRVLHEPGEHDLLCRRGRSVERAEHNADLRGMVHAEIGYDLEVWERRVVLITGSEDIEAS